MSEFVTKRIDMPREFLCFRYRDSGMWVEWVTNPKYRLLSIPEPSHKPDLNTMNADMPYIRGLLRQFPEIELVKMTVSVEPFEFNE